VVRSWFPLYGSPQPLLKAPLVIDTGLLANLVLAAYFVCLFIVLLYSAHQFVLLLAYWFVGKRTVAEPRTPAEDLPHFTLQLPTYNEQFVVDRLLESVSKLDWPRERLHIQVLDDSTDESVELTRLACDRLRARGFDIEYLHRSNREGFKAGALDHGMATAKGEFIAILDADFLPQADFLRRLAPHFADPRVGVVQMRWGHLNREFSLLTQCQAMMIDGHFIVEHGARQGLGLFFNFNGTAGAWRRTAIEDAGGWEHDTLTEDLDLSYRAQLKGWRFVFLPDQAVPGELPPDIQAFKVQQQRWAKGGAQTCLKLLGRVWKSPVSLLRKVEATFHLTNYMTVLCLMVVAVLTYPAMELRQEMAIQVPWLDVPALFLGTFAICAFYLTGQAVAGYGFLGGLRFLPAMLCLGAGLSLNNAKGVVEAVLGIPSEFTRTPKFGTGFLPGGVRLSPYVSRHLGLAIAETLLACVFLAMIGKAVDDQVYAAVPVLTLFLLGFLWTGGMSLADIFRRPGRKMQPESSPLGSVSAGSR
jgi:cellulose synthase/poly-beta-1,6-N-acetylglucosamine synthase-like glycosyltransferase